MEGSSPELTAGRNAFPEDLPDRYDGNDHPRLKVFLDTMRRAVYIHHKDVRYMTFRMEWGLGYREKPYLVDFWEITNGEETHGIAGETETPDRSRLA